MLTESWDRKQNPIPDSDNFFDRRKHNLTTRFKSTHKHMGINHISTVVFSGSFVAFIKNRNFLQKFTNIIFTKPEPAYFYPTIVFY